MTRPESRTTRALVVLLAAALMFGGVPTPAAAQSTATIAGTQIAPDDVSLRVDIQPDGTATWEVEYRVRLDEENKTEAFESVRSDVEANESSYVSEFGSRMNATAATAENATGRSMSVGNVSVTTSRQQLPQEYGIITYSFTWTNFAAAEDGRIRAGDALAGFFLDGETSLLVTWPEGYAVESVSPAPDDRRTQAVAWNGPLDFGPGEPTLVLSASPAESPSASETPAPGDDGGSARGDFAVLGGLALLVVGVVVGGGWVLYRRYDDGTDRPRTQTAATPGGPTDDGDSVGGRSDARTADAPAATAENDGDDGDSEESGESGADASEDDAADDGRMPWEDELLSNEECVLALIEHEGGRLKQQEVAGTLDWTDAKTSQVVRKMRDEGTLDAFRLGRENVLVLPDGEGDEDGDHDAE